MVTNLLCSSLYNNFHSLINLRTTSIVFHQEIELQSVKNQLANEQTIETTRLILSDKPQWNRESSYRYYAHPIHKCSCSNYSMHM